jgi:deoxyribonuclease (pyrimidine dimer)
MVRINLINPRKLADQHLIAEYNEILMLLGYVIRYPVVKDIPEEFTLNKGHIKFFKNKLVYIKKRHETLKKEMRERGFVTNKTIKLSDYPQELHQDWRPAAKDKLLIKERIREKIHFKPEYYRYHGEFKDKEFFLGLLK